MADGREGYCECCDGSGRVLARNTFNTRAELVVEEIPKCDHHSASEKQPSQEFTFLDLKEKLAETYHRLTHVVSNNRGPIRYAYYETTMPAHLFDVIAVPNYRMFDSDVVSKWQSLNDKEKRHLFMVLYCTRYIFTGVSYSFRTRKWEKQLNASTLDTRTCLRGYGKKIEEGSNLLTYLAGGNITECLETVYSASFELHVSWMLALKSNMMNNDARMAVRDLLNRIKVILHGFEDKFPSVWVVNVTSPTATDAVSSSSTSCSLKHDTRESIERRYVEEGHKRKGTLGVGAKRRRMNVESEDHGDAGEQEAKAHRRHVDLAVACHDNIHGRVYYLLVIEILSHSKTMAQAEKQFKEEMIHVLQSQFIVFGLLFGPEEVVLYKAERDQTGEIKIGHTKYDLIDKCDDSDLLYGKFNVGSFQWMVMDILSCLIQGIKVLCVGPLSSG